MKEDLKSIGKRLLEARKAAGLTQTQVGRVLGHTKQQISHWERGRSEISIFDIQKIAVMYGVSMDNILTGKALKEPGFAQKMKFNHGRVVPKARRDDIIKLAADPTYLDAITERRQCYADCSKSAFSFEIFDNAMDGGAHPIEVSNLVTVDRNKLPQPGECILLVLIKSNDILFRRYKASGMSRELAAPFKLSADNLGYDDVEIPADATFVFLGTMVEHLRLSSR